jgi:hypothetical protein
MVDNDVMVPGKPQIDPSRAAPRFALLPPATQRLLRLCDGERDLAALASASRMPPSTVTSMLRSLSEQGLVREPAAPSPRKLSPRGEAWLRGAVPDPVTFSDDEERFFASSIDHLVQDEWESL